MVDLRFIQSNFQYLSENKLIWQYNENARTANIGFASVWLLYQVEHLSFLLDLVLNLNFDTYFSTPNAKPKNVGGNFVEPKIIRNLNRILVLVFFELVLSSCSNKLIILSDGWTRVTGNQNNFKNISKFNTDILRQIDTSFIYKEYGYMQSLDSSAFGLNKQKRYTEISFPNSDRREYYRFYSNGNCNLFIKEPNAIINLQNFNPNLTGFRGVFYKDEKNRTCIDLFTQITGYGKFGILKQFIRFSGDTMFVKTQSMRNSSRIFLKTKMENDLREINKWTN